MKWVPVILALFAPSAILVFLSLQPQADSAVTLPLFHFYIVTFTAFAAAVVSILLSSTLEGVAPSRHVLAAVAFAVVATVFFLHGLATRGALIDYSHPAVRWSAWLTLFGGGISFALAGLDGAAGLPRWLPLRRIVHLTVAGVILYWGVAILAPQWLTRANEQGEVWQWVISLLSLALWLFAAFRLWQIWRVTHSRVDGALAFVAFWLAHAVVSMHQFPVWNSSWWLYHFLLCLGFLITTYILVSEYEQVRQFRLLRYYLGIALICTAFLALLASYLFAEFSHRLLVAEIKASTTNLVKTITLTMAGTTPAELEPMVRLANYAAQLPGESLGNIYLYDTEGEVFYPSDEGSASSLVIDRLRFAQALAGETVVEVRSPDEAANNNPFGAVYTVETYTPLPTTQSSGASTRPAGVLVALQAAPQLGQAILRARATGLIVSALTMGLLFIILLAVIHRADQIIAGRAEELLQAYSSLRQAETMRDDLSHMIIHDLRNPLNIISATFELIRLNQGEARLKTLDHFWDSAYAATHRMIGLIDDILAVSKFEAGQLNPQFSATLLARFLAERLNGFKPQAAMENKQLALDCPPDLMVELDPALMGRVIENLVSNAFKYTPEVKGLIHVLACVENSRVRLSVRDNGEGIPDEYKGRIFDKFTQASNTNGHSARRGVGLGLAFCSLIVQAHGGQIGVIDAPGGGSEFVLTLPQRQ